MPPKGASTYTSGALSLSLCRQFTNSGLLENDTLTRSSRSSRSSRGRGALRTRGTVTLGGASRGLALGTGASSTRASNISPTGLVLAYLELDETSY